MLLGDATSSKPWWKLYDEVSVCMQLCSATTFQLRMNMSAEVSASSKLRLNVSA
jgi:hypothetical protein